MELPDRLENFTKEQLMHLDMLVDQLDEALRDADPRGMHLAAFHPTGTARAGGDAQRSPVDGHGRLRGVDGVWVADASIVPSCPEVNPQVTIMTLALSIAAGIVGSEPVAVSARSAGKDTT